ncbi:MAG: tetratricopeptide repeat protein [Myxococcaceae bacterium]
MRRFLFVTLCLFAACGPRAYQKAQTTDTIDAYREFLRDNPKDENVEAARVRLAELEFEEAKKVHTPLAYKRFIEEFPDTSQARAAQSLLEALRFNAAMEKATVESLRQFLADHPDGAHAEDARKKLGELELKQAQQSSDRRTLEEIARAYPDDPRGAEARNRLDAQRFQEAKASGADALYSYLADFPAGAYREEAQTELLSYKLQGLFFSHLVDQARAELERNPLAEKIPDAKARLQAAEEERALIDSRDPKIANAFAEHYLRGIDDLEKSLGAPDPLDRWQAAAELGQHVSVAVIDPLLNVVRAGRNPLFRHRAFESLREIIHALPPSIAQYELATRLNALRANAVTPETELVIAVLLDLSGNLEAAAAEYQKSYLPDAPDPVVLMRWIEIREQRKQWFSAAVAARQLALWAESVINDAQLVGGESLPVSLARELCAAAEGARIANETIANARGQKTEFPEDLLQFELKAKDVSKLAEARLKDTELKLHTQDRNARSCRDHQINERLAASELERLAAVKAIADKPPKNARQILDLVQRRDPSPKVRAQAQTLLAALKM